MIAFNLITSTDVEDTEEKIKKYELDNRLAIETNLTLMELEAEEIKLRDEELRKVASDTKDEYIRLDEEDRIAKLKEKEIVLASLVSRGFFFFFFFFVDERIEYLFSFHPMSFCYLFRDHQPLQPLK